MNHTTSFFCIARPNRTSFSHHPNEESLLSNHPLPALHGWRIINIKPSSYHSQNIHSPNNIHYSSNTKIRNTSIIFQLQYSNTTTNIYHKVTSSPAAHQNSLSTHRINHITISPYNNTILSNISKWTTCTHSYWLLLHFSLYPP